MRVQVPLSLVEWSSGLWRWSWKPKYLFRYRGFKSHLMYIFFFMVKILFSNFYINFIELKIRLFYFFFSLFLTFLFCFCYRLELFFLISFFFNYNGLGFFYLGLLDPIIVYLKISVFSSFFFNFFNFFYFLIFFFFRSFFNAFTKFYFLICLFNLFFVYVIVMLFFYVFFPFFFSFLLSFQQDAIDNFSLVLLPSFTNYYSLFFNLIVFFLIVALSLNFFLFYSFIQKQFIFKSRMLLFFFNLTFVLIFSPPDIFFQLYFLIFIFLVIELFIYFNFYFFNLYCLYI